MRSRLVGKVRLGAEILEDRLAPAVFDISGGVATYTGDAGANDVTVGLNSGTSTYQINDSDTTITLGSGAVLLGWTGSGTNTIIGPKSSVSSYAFSLGGGANSLTIGASGFIDPIAVPLSSVGAGTSDAFSVPNVGSGINESTGDISITNYTTISVQEPLVATSGNVTLSASGSVTIASQLIGNSASVTSTAGSIEFDPFAVGIPNLNAGTMSAEPQPATSPPARLGSSPRGIADASFRHKRHGKPHLPVQPDDPGRHANLPGRYRRRLVGKRRHRHRCSDLQEPGRHHCAVQLHS